MPRYSGEAGPGSGASCHPPLPRLSSGALCWALTTGPTRAHCLQQTRALGLAPVTVQPGWLQKGRLPLSKAVALVAILYFNAYQATPL